MVIKQNCTREKRVIILSFAALVLIFSILSIAILFWTFRPYSPQLTLERLETAMNSDAYQVLVGDICYLLDSCEPLADFCQFSQWQESNSNKAGAHILTIRLAEEWELAFYENGYAKAYDGYCSNTYKDTVWYTVPAGVAETLQEHIISVGTEKDMFLGPASWFAITD